MKRRRRLLNEFVLITLVVWLLLLLSIFSTQSVLYNSIFEQNKQSSGIIYQQALAQIVQFEDDVEVLRLSLINDHNVLSFFEIQDFSSRWSSLSEVRHVTGNSRRINHSLENIAFYDVDDKLFFSHGVTKLDYHNPDNQQKIIYSGIIDAPFDSKKYIEAAMLVYSGLNGGQVSQLGAIHLLYSAETLQEALENALLNDASGIGLVDHKGNTLLSAGQWQQEFTYYDRDTETEEELVYANRIGNTGWTLINVIAKNSLLDGVILTQQIIYLTYVAVIAVLVLMSALLYWRVLRPITKQIAFMSNYKQASRIRTGIFMNNEIGDLATEMNLMLDNIENLNKENIEMRQRNFELQYKKKQAELIAYRSQINPHFLYNTFECIQGMALYHGIKDIANIVQSMSKLFRQSVSGGELTTVQDELKSLRHYAKIVSYRFNDKYKIDIHANPSSLSCQMPKMLLQPLVENAVLHGLEPIAEAGYVLVRVVYVSETHELDIHVNDNGRGMNQTDYEQILSGIREYDQSGVMSNYQNGIGLMNVYHRLRLYYASDLSFDIDTKENEGTSIHIKISLNGGES